jgi:hypothetical protein
MSLLEEKMVDIMGHGADMDENYRVGLAGAELSGASAQLKAELRKVKKRAANELTQSLPAGTPVFAGGAKTRIMGPAVVTESGVIHIPVDASNGTILVPASEIEKDTERAKSYEGKASAEIEVCEWNLVHPIGTYVGVRGLFDDEYSRTCSPAIVAADGSARVFVHGCDKPVALENISLSYMEEVPEDTEFDDGKESEDEDTQTERQAAIARIAALADGDEVARLKAEIKKLTEKLAMLKRPGQATGRQAKVQAKIVDLAVELSGLILDGQSGGNNLALAATIYGLAGKSIDSLKPDGTLVLKGLQKGGIYVTKEMGQVISQWSLESGDVNHPAKVVINIDGKIVEELAADHGLAPYDAKGMVWHPTRWVESLGISVGDGKSLADKIGQAAIDNDIEVEDEDDNELF